MRIANPEGAILMTGDGRINLYVRNFVYLVCEYWFFIINILNKLTAMPPFFIYTSPQPGYCGEVLVTGII